MAPPPGPGNGMSEEVEEVRQELVTEISDLEERIRDIKDKIAALESIIRLMAAIQLRTVPLTAFTQRDLLNLVEELRKKVNEL